MSVISAAPAHPISLRLNTPQIGDQKIEIWTTRLGACENLLLSEQVEMLCKDTRDRLMPLLRKLTQGKQIFVGRPYDSNDPDWLAQIEPCTSLEDAIAKLQAEGISAEIIDSLNEEDGILSIGFMQLERLGTGFREVYPESEVQFIHALS